MKSLYKALWILIRAFAMLIYLLFLGVAWGFSFGLTNIWMRLIAVFVPIVIFAPEIKRIFNTSKKLQVFLTIVFLSTTGIHYFQYQALLRSLFESYVSSPIPSTVKFIRGDRGRWLDPETYLVFKTEINTFKSLIKDYSEISTHEAWQGRLGEFGGGQMNIFMREASYLKKNPNLKYYYRSRRKNNMNSDKVSGYREESYLIWDADQEKAYYFRPFVTSD